MTPASGLLQYTALTLAHGQARACKIICSALDPLPEAKTMIFFGPLGMSML